MAWRCEGQSRHGGTSPPTVDRDHHRGAREPYTVRYAARRDVTAIASRASRGAQRETAPADGLAPKLHADLHQAAQARGAGLDELGSSSQAILE